ncbi:carboxypeptidase-like regulatory domain-containing protein [Paracoccus sp. WLY502]|uniref:carboxypeptidase-like regulatory domain-containing protein n=1 Tax=Paracoccus yibinensis TaxID=3068891 RepID=UPI0027968635|nr:carboxypeptidase-like regulatory domain-containing protein [Paracoccus sp. WLY502]MDQ1899419.1 carboxypeptidase-like regulatory domain-containing protein [Paracoccus sp. WLY502]
MPGKATIKGTLKDAFGAPIVGGKVIATMVGSDAFENGARLASRKIDATTDANGSWSLSLIVNGEGRHGSSTWKIEAFDAAVVPIYTVEKLFILNTAEILLDDLEQVTAANEAAV